MRAIQLDTDLEGLLALNDNAFELCRDFLPQGDRFFRQVNRYDDYLAEIRKKPDYQAGNTLKLILPFLKGHGFTNDRLREYSTRHVSLMPGAAETFKFLQERGFPLFALSTSYRLFAEAAAFKLGFDAEHLCCTELDLDRYRVAPAEAEELQRLEAEIAAAPEIQLPREAASPEDLPGPVQEAVALLDRIFWERLPEMGIGLILQEVNPVGGSEKAQAVSESMERTGISLADTMYVGDNLTDVQAFEAVRAGGGLTISFNGNREAVSAAEVVVVSDTAWPLALLATIFQTWAKQDVLDLASPERRGKSRSLILPEAVIEPIMLGLQGHTFNLHLSQAPQRDRMVQESVAMRARLRGEAIASLG
jgi:energy-converting hydrogenase A subunit R